MVHGGWKYTAAIDKIKEHYGHNFCVTEIIKKMREDANSENGYPRIFDYDFHKSSAAV